MIEINLLPWREQLKSDRRSRQFLEAGGAAVLALLVLLVFHTILGFQLQAVKLRLNQAESGLARVTQRLEALHLVYQELDYQKLPDVDLSAIFNYQSRILDFLQKLAQALPPDLYARQISLDGQIWLIEGVSARLKAILGLADQFKARFKDGNLTIRQKNSLFYYQLRLEAGL